MLDLSRTKLPNANLPNAKLSQAKAMARTLRDGLSGRSISLSHSACLELVAHQFGFANWNVLAARLESSPPPLAPLAIPKGWFATGSVTPESHRLGLDPATPGAILIESRLERGQGLGALTDRIAVLMQSVAAEAYCGQRLRLSVDLRCRDADCGTIWMRVDGRERMGLAFDNMLTRTTDGPLTGDRDWTRRSVVLDVPDAADSLHYGLFLKGYGQVWARRVRLDGVGPEIPVTGEPRTPPRCDKGQLAAAPTNLDFREA